MIFHCSEADKLRNFPILRDLPNRETIRYVLKDWNVPFILSTHPMIRDTILHNYIGIHLYYIHTKERNLLTMTIFFLLLCAHKIIIFEKWQQLQRTKLSFLQNDTINFSKIWFISIVLRVKEIMKIGTMSLYSLIILYCVCVCEYICVYACVYGCSDKSIEWRIRKSWSHFV